MTDLAKLRSVAERAAAVAPGEWEMDSERQTDAPDRHREYFVIDGRGNRMFGTENADAGFGSIEIDYVDEDGFASAWNEASRSVISFVTAAQPRIIIALLDRPEKAETAMAQNAAIAALAAPGVPGTEAE